MMRMLKSPGYWIGVGAGLFMLGGISRWLKLTPHNPFAAKERVIWRERVVTNWANPESVQMPPNYTNYTLCVSTGYCHWFLIVSNRTDDWEVHYVNEIPTR